MRDFEPHGDYRIETDGRIFKVCVEGTANRELMEVYARDMDARVDELRGQPFAQYLDYVSDALLIDESIIRLKESLAERMAKGMCAIAFNLTKITAPSVTSAQISAIYDEVGLPWLQVEDYQDARSWLQARIADADRAAGRS